MSTPKGLKLAKTDEWVKLEDKLGTIGISDYAQDQLSDIVFVEFLKESGDKISKGELLATIESVKAAADVISPVGGTVKEVNEKLLDAPEMLNSDPFTDGWMMKVELDSPSDTDALLNSEDYDTFCESR